MVEIVFMPWKKIIVHEISELQNKPFFEWFMAEALKQNTTTASVSWANGIAFVIGNFLETPETVKEKMNGMLHYAQVTFTRIGQQAQFPVTMKDGSKYNVGIVPSDNSDLHELTLKLKNWEKPKLLPGVSKDSS